MEYTWSQQKSFNEDKVLDFLPLKEIIQRLSDPAFQIVKTIMIIKLRDIDHNNNNIND